VGERTLRTVGRNGNQPHDAHPCTLSVTDHTGSDSFTQDTDVAHSFCIYLRIENAEGYVLIAIYSFIYLYACYSHN